MIEYAILVGLVIAFTKIVRDINRPNLEEEVKFFPETYLPIIAIVIAVVINLFSSFAGSDVIISGIMAGLVSMGLYDVGNKTIYEGFIENKKKKK